MSDPLQSLLRRVGRYGGHGINHADEPFYGELDLHPLLDGSAAGQWHVVFGACAVVHRAAAMKTVCFSMGVSGS